MGDATATRRSLRLVGSATGLQLAVAGPVLLLPLFGLIAYPGEASAILHLAGPALLLGGLGLLIHRLCRDPSGAIPSLHEGSLAVVIAWGLVSVVSAIPFMSLCGLDFSQAVFESVSAWTTTGLSVVPVERASKLLLLYRSTLQLAGGAGIAILLLVISGGPMGPGLAAAEGRDDRLAPHLVRSARLVFVLYTGYAVAGTLALWWAGMSAFDAVNHSFAAISTGGFSTRTDSIGHWDSALVEAVTMIFMILGSLNFQTAFLLVVRRRFATVSRDGEIRLACVLGAIFFVLFLLLVAWPLFSSATKAVRVALFEVVSALTTTGFSTTPYPALPGLGVALLIPLMLVGGSTGSTAGGLKQHRVHVAFEAIWSELRLANSPRGRVIEPSVRHGDSRLHLDESTRLRVLVFIALYLLIFLGGTVALMAFGYSMQESAFEFASALGTVGLSVGPASPSAPAGALWVMTTGMFLGRLEIVIVLVGLSRFVSAVRALVGTRTGLRVPASSASARGWRG